MSTYSEGRGAVWVPGETVGSVVWERLGWRSDRDRNMFGWEPVEGSSAFVGEARKGSGSGGEV